MSDPDLDDLIHAADLDGLVRMIDNRCATGDWDGLLRARDRARGAVKTGRQLWPAVGLVAKVVRRVVGLAPLSSSGVVSQPSVRGLRVAGLRTMSGSIAMVQGELRIVVVELVA